MKSLLFSILFYFINLTICTSLDAQDFDPLSALRILVGYEYVQQRNNFIASNAASRSALQSRVDDGLAIVASRMMSEDKLLRLQSERNRMFLHARSEFDQTIFDWDERIRNAPSFLREGDSLYYEISDNATPLPEILAWQIDFIQSASCSEGERFWMSRYIAATRVELDRGVVGCGLGNKSDVEKIRLINPKRCLAVLSGAVASATNSIALGLATLMPAEAVEARLRTLLNVPGVTGALAASILYASGAEGVKLDDFYYAGRQRPDEFMLWRAKADPRSIAALRRFRQEFTAEMLSAVERAKRTDYRNHFNPRYVTFDYDLIDRVVANQPASATKPKMK